MSTFKTNTKKVTHKGEQIEIITKKNFDSFSESILGLGPIEKESKPIQAMSVMFDLEGFTKFCKQIDPQLAVPEFLSSFLKWIFNQIKEELKEETLEEGYKTYGSFPFLSKFMGFC